MVPCSAMLCQQATLSGDAEWPKVADAVIEAGAHLPAPEAMLQQLLAFTQATECHSDDYYPLGTDTGCGPQYDLLDSGLRVTHDSTLQGIQHRKDARGDQYHGENALK